MEAHIPYTWPSGISELYRMWLRETAGESSSVRALCLIFMFNVILELHTPSGSYPHQHLLWAVRMQSPGQHTATESGWHAGGDGFKLLPRTPAGQSPPLTPPRNLAGPSLMWAHSSVAFDHFLSFCYI